MNDKVYSVIWLDHKQLGLFFLYQFLDANNRWRKRVYLSLEISILNNEELMETAILENSQNISKLW